MWEGGTRLQLPSANVALELLSYQYEKECTRLGIPTNPPSGISATAALADVQIITVQNERSNTMFDILREVRRKSSHESQETEISKFMKEDPAEDNQSVLQYWSARSTKYPILSKLAKKFLAIPASSSGVERIFSIAGSLARARRARLQPKTLENVIFLRQSRKPILVKRLAQAGLFKKRHRTNRKRATL